MASLGVIIIQCVELVHNKLPECFVVSSSVIKMVGREIISEHTKCILYCLNILHQAKQCVIARTETIISLITWNHQ